MSRNLNSQTVLLTTVQSAGADVVTGNGGELKVTGVEAIDLRKVNKTTYLASTAGNPQIHTITSTTTIAASTTYSGSITQVVEGATYTWPFTYTTPSSAPGAAAFYAAIEDKIQEGIDGNQILGTVTSSGSGTVFTCTTVAPVAYVTLSNLTDVVTSTVTFAYSAVTNATPRVATSTGATGAVTGKLYRVRVSSATGAGAADLSGRTLIAKATSATDFTLYGTSNTGAITGMVATIVNDAADNLQDYLVGCDGYVSTDAFVGFEVDYESSPDLDAGIQIPQAIIADATLNSDANIANFVNAMITALNGSSSSTVLNTFGA
jgi:hypothetical protein